MRLKERSAGIIVAMQQNDCEYQDCRGVLRSGVIEAQRASADHGTNVNGHFSGTAVPKCLPYVAILPLYLLQGAGFTGSPYFR
mgnify:CR=1 FL=1